MSVMKEAETVEVSMLEPEVVVAIRQLKATGLGERGIARVLGINRKTVRRWLEGPITRVQERPQRRKLDAAKEALVRELFSTVAEGNAAVVVDELAKKGIAVSARTIQRVVAPVRQAAVAAAVATTRFETRPGEQMQVDFGQKRVRIGENDVVVHLMAAVLGYSRRIYVKAFLVERAEDWREGILEAWRHFGGVARTLLVDNSRCLVLRHDVERRSVEFHPGLVALAREGGVLLRACAPYRARTKGKIESGVKFVKRNALAKRSFSSFAELEQHLSWWMEHVDNRVHGTTNEVPRERFVVEEKALLPLPSPSLKVRGERRLKRRIANDAFVDVDTVRYSVPIEHARRHADVLIVEDEVRVFVGGDVVATHVRCREPHTVVEERTHRRGLYRQSETTSEASSSSSSSSFARPLSAYAEVLENELPRPSGLSSTDSSTVPKRPVAEVRGEGEEASAGGAA
jgi:transposase